MWGGREEPAQRIRATPPLVPRERVALPEVEVVVSRARVEHQRLLQIQPASGIGLSGCRFRVCNFRFADFSQVDVLGSWFDPGGFRTVE